ncbi:thiamine pyrophosphate-binding protein [Nocardia sp. CDC159]|uniref:acetolactate synthase n=1 Tax=Nocardia pulmonis TaxID=2951408 RepID=A0A9X2E457_9NOCA|nr:MULTISPECIES: thiamine pyrophosphate-binding protein [Nocardia]MCM6773967.1 thiamine pyrophosphate-binding protein [Nocardia pulmonis]MCM6786854.1 thiamine pyrophosphate-binding protein [Nocardia sp. CDC159]
MRRLAVDGIWAEMVDILERRGPRLYIGVPGDEPDIIDAARAAGATWSAQQDQRTAGYAAVGWSRITGRAAVLATASGPNLLNALIGIAEAYTTRTPLLVVTTVVRDAVVGRGGFQEFPVAGLSGGLFTWTHRIADRAELSWAVARALHLAEHGRGGPVHLLVDPELVDAEAVEMPRNIEAGQPIPPGQTAEALGPVLAALSAARRPVLLFGGGTRRADVVEFGVPLADSLNALCLVTASGRGVFPEDHRRFGGVAGLYLPPQTRAALHDADVVVVLGSQLEETALMGWEHPDRSCLVHVDTDPAVFNRAVAARFSVLCEAGFFVRVAHRELPAPTAHAAAWWTPWQRVTGETAGGIETVRFWSALREALPGNGIEVIAQENGLADLWGYYAPCFTLPAGIAPLVPGEQTPLGFGLGAALGAALGGRRALAVGGDGAFLTNLPTLVAAGRARADICYICLDNGGFGWPSLARDDTGMVDFDVADGISALAGTAGFGVEMVSKAESLAETLAGALAASGPRLVVVRLCDRPSFPPTAPGDL